MSNLPHLYKLLKLYSDFEKDENSENFLDVLEKIVSKNDPSSIPILFSYFDDKSDYTWIMESIMLALENYEINSFLKEFLKGLSDFIKISPLRSKGLLYAILNHDSYMHVFSQNMHLADKESLLKLFDLMQKESPNHVELITELRRELNSK